jgi:hypothetical protein
VVLEEEGQVAGAAKATASYALAKAEVVVGLSRSSGGSRSFDGNVLDALGIKRCQL